MVVRLQKSLLLVAVVVVVGAFHLLFPFASAIDEQAARAEYLRSLPIGTVVDVYTGPAFAGGAPTRFRAPSPDAPCANLPAEVAGRVGSVDIHWNTPPLPPMRRNRAMCGEVWLWQEEDCGGRGLAWQLPGIPSANIFDYTIQDTEIRSIPPAFSTAKSVSCRKYVPNKCSGVICGDNARCVLEGGEPTCRCNTGMEEDITGACVDSCSGKECPAGTHCEVEADTPVCRCDKAGFVLADSGVCQDACATCPASATCSVDSGVAKCTCPDGQRLQDGQCVDPCDSVMCPADTQCQAKAGVPRCKCLPGLELTADGCTPKELVPHAEYLGPHNEARAAVGSPPLVWDDQLATKASDWVHELATQERCRLAHTPELVQPAAGTPAALATYGQNMVALCCSPRLSTRRAVEVWLAEGKRYSPAAALDVDGGGGCSTGDWRDCGHFTQAVWRSTTQVGCAKAKCGSSGEWTAWVCNYSPPGNIVGESVY